uniref:C2H2-type domain-containing protein n=1 Tax=Globodera rostochiensis TaxID=31243 RepID=A0A914H268_GLORO
MSVQIKWLNDGRFRRFELVKLNFSALLHELQKRVPTFRGSICYVDDQNDKIVLGENVTRIQTDDLQQSTSSNDWLAESGLDKPSAADQHAKGMGESESADEGIPKERAAKRKASCGNKIVNKAELAEFVEEEEGVAEWPNFGRQSSESAASSSFLVGGGGDFSQFDESLAGTSNATGVENANDLTRKKRTKSAVIPCMDCGMLVANASTSLKSHVNLHHLKKRQLCGTLRETIRA